VAYVNNGDLRNTTTCIFGGQESTNLLLIRVKHSLGKIVLTLSLSLSTKLPLTTLPMGTLVKAPLSVKY